MPIWCQFRLFRRLLNLTSQSLQCSYILMTISHHHFETFFTPCPVKEAVLMVCYADCIGQAGQDLSAQKQLESMTTAVATWSQQSTLQVGLNWHSRTCFMQPLKSGHLHLMSMPHGNAYTESICNYYLTWHTMAPTSACAHHPTQAIQASACASATGKGTGKGLCALHLACHALANRSR